MRRSHVALLGLALTLIACGESAPVTTETSATPAASAPTATVPGGPTAIPASGILKWTAGDSYVADDFWVPVSITPADDGWWSLGVTEVWLYLQWHDGDSSLFDLDMVVLAHAPNAAVADVVTAITGDEAVDVTAEPTATTVANRDGVVVDVVVPGEIDEDEEIVFRGHARSIAALQGLRLFVESDPTSGQGGSVAGTFGFGVRRGRKARIWVLDVAGSTITGIAAASDPEAFDALAPVAERLVAGFDFVP